MAISKLLPAGGANDFNIAITGSHTTITFSKEFSSGGYSIVSSAGDTTIDIYAYNADGSSAGYTATKSFSAAKGFNKMVILGGTNGDLLSFTFKQTFTSAAASNETTAGPVITSFSTSACVTIDSTTIVTGKNFASNMTATFVGTDATVRNAKTVAVASATSATITRPDDLPIAYSPYTVTLTNPGVSAPVGSSPHIATNAITAGNAPVWVTGNTLASYTKNVAYTATVVANDPSDATGAIASYSVVTDLLPTGMTFTATSAIISGTASVVTAGSITIRATDNGGNFVDRTFTIPNVGTSAPVWSTGATSLALIGNGNAYTATVVATDDSGLTPTYSTVSGTLPTGISFNTATGVISGTPSGMTAGQTFTYTIRATDTNGSFTDRAFVISQPTVVVATSNTSITTTSAKNFRALLVGGGARGQDGHNQGGGSGYVNYYQLGSVPAGTITFTIGGAGGTTTLNANGTNYTASPGSSASGGSGGGGSGNAGSGGAGGSNGGGGSSGATNGGGPGQGSPFPLANLQYPGTNYGFFAGAGGSASGGSHGGGGGGGGVSASNPSGFSIPAQRSGGIGGTTGIGFGGGGSGGGYNGSYYPGLDGQPGLIYLWEY